MSELQEQKKKTVELILSRPLELLAIDTNDFKKEQLESLLKALNKNLYLLANQVVNTLFQEFWGLDAEGLWQNEKVRSVFRAYIEGYAKAKEAEKAIQELYKKKVEKPDGKTDEQFDEELKNLKELKKSTLEGIKHDLMKYIESEAFKDDKALMLTAANFKTNVAKYIGEESQAEITHSTTHGKKIIDRVLDNIVRRTAFEVLQNFLHEIEDVLTAKGTRQLRQYDRSIPIYFDYDYNFEPFQYTDKIIRREIKQGKGQPNKIEEVTETVCRFVWMPVWAKANTVDMRGGIQFEINFGADKSKNEDFVKEVMEKYKNRNKEDGPAAHQAVGDSHIKIDWRRNKKFLQQTFKRKVDPKHDPEYFKKGLCMGVDLGYKIPLYWGLSDLSDAKPLGDKEQIKKLCTQYENRIRDLQRKVKSADLSGNTAHGKLGELQKLRQKERLSVKQLNRKYAKKLVGIAVEKRAGTIVLEDIDFTKKREELEKRRLALNEKLTDWKLQKTYPSIYDRLFTMFRNWSYGQLIRFIKEEAEEQGIEVVSIDPTYTSQICCVCGVKGQRGSQEYLTVTREHVCERGNCPAKDLDKLKKQKIADRGYKHLIPADRNAAFNIAQGGAVMVTEKNTMPTAIEQGKAQTKAERELTKNKPDAGNPKYSKARK